MPDVMLASAAGLELGEAGGVRCSSGLETSVPGIYAAGDICEYDSPIHGAPAARRALGRGLQPRQDGRAEHARPRRASTTRCPTSSPTSPTGPRWSTWARARASRSIRGSLDDGDFTAFYVDDGQVTAALTVGRSDDLEHAQPLPHGAHAGGPGRAGRREHGPRLALAVTPERLTIFRNLLSGRRKSGRSSAPKMGPSTIVTKKNRTKAIARGSIQPALCSATCYRCY